MRSLDAARVPSRPRRRGRAPARRAIPERRERHVDPRNGKRSCARIYPCQDRLGLGDCRDHAPLRCAPCDCGGAHVRRTGIIDAMKPVPVSRLPAGALLVLPAFGPELEFSPRRTAARLARSASAREVCNRPVSAHARNRSMSRWRPATCSIASLPAGCAASLHRRVTAPARTPTGGVAGEQRPGPRRSARPSPTQALVQSRMPLTSRPATRTLSAWKSRWMSAAPGFWMDCNRPRSSGSIGPNRVSQGVLSSGQGGGASRESRLRTPARHPETERGPRSRANSLPHGLAFAPREDHRRTALPCPRNQHRRATAAPAARPKSMRVAPQRRFRARRDARHEAQTCHRLPASATRPCRDSPPEAWTSSGPRTQILA